VSRTGPTPFGVLGPALRDPYRLPAASSVCVVVTAINEGSDFEMTLASLSRRLRASDRVVIVDDASIVSLEDRTRAAAAAAGREFVFIRNATRQGCARARDIGSRAVDSDLYVFIDSHMIFPDSWLPEILAAHDASPRAILCPISADIEPGADRVLDGGHWGTNADLYFHPERGLTAKWAPLSVRGRSGSIRTPAVMGACYAVPRAVLRGIGGWSMGLRGWGFDEEFACARAWMLGFEVRLVSSTYAAHRYTRRAEDVNRVDVTGEDEAGYVQAYSRLYMNHVLFGKRIAVGSSDDIERAEAESVRAAHEWRRDREFILSRRIMDEPGFWSMMNDVRGDANIQLDGARYAVNQ
jgi:GT2 family glycosyltransferase